MRANPVGKIGADAYLAHQLPWQWFVTLTWQSQFSRSQQIQHVVHWIKEVRKLFQLHRLGYLVRWERGEAGGRVHAHLLMFGFEAEQMNSASQRYMEVLWRIRGLARVRRYTGGESAYALKNAYEIGKFGRATESVYWNATAWGLLCELRNVSTRSDA